jgi:hypothetical protein
MDSSASGRPSLQLPPSRSSGVEPEQRIEQPVEPSRMDPEEP